MPAPRNNKNAVGRRVERERIPISISLSDGLLDLTSDYLLSQGIDPNAENVRQLVRDWFYPGFGEWLKRQIETNEGAIIV